jgi:hypothetical protein
MKVTEGKKEGKKQTNKLTNRPKEGLSMWAKEMQ